MKKTNFLCGFLFAFAALASARRLRIDLHQPAQDELTREISALDTDSVRCLQPLQRTGQAG